MENEGSVPMAEMLVTNIGANGYYATQTEEFWERDQGKIEKYYKGLLLIASDYADVKFAENVLAEKAAYEYLHAPENQALNKLVPFTHPALAARPVQKLFIQEITSSPFIRQVMAEMREIAYAGQNNQTGKPKLVGLHAAQLGYDLDILAYDKGADGKGGTSGELRFLFNMQVVAYTKKTWRYFEGCRSLGRVCGTPERPWGIRFQAFDANGQFVDEYVEGFIARVLQHEGGENGHGGGILFPELIDDPKHLHLVLTFPEDENQMNLYRNNWENWPYVFPMDSWNFLNHAFRGKLPRTGTVPDWQTILKNYLEKYAYPVENPTENI